MSIYDLWIEVFLNDLDDCGLQTVNSSHRCSDANSHDLHKREMEEAAQKAREDYERDHPEARGQELKHNPLEHIQSMNATDQHFNVYGTWQSL